MLSLLDQWLNAPRVRALNALAIGWFLAITLACRMSIPNIPFFRCPIGFCAGGYEPEDVSATLLLMGAEGRRFVADVLLPLDLVLPPLLLLALGASILWYSRPNAEADYRIDNRVRLGLLVVPCLYAAADMAEARTLGALVASYPDIPAALARTASRLTSAKSQLVALSIGLAAALALGRRFARGVGT